MLDNDHCHLFGALISNLDFSVVLMEEKVTLSITAKALQ
jgi:hypothetical protein